MTRVNRQQPPTGTTKEIELGFLLTLKNYIDAVVSDSLAKHGLDANLPSAPKSIRPNKWIYFIQGVDGGPVKIGIANDPEKRLAELQRTSPVELRVVARKIGDTFDEKALHEKFSEWRLHGEWFDPCAELLEEMEAHA